jgi:glutamate-1-semialdehyde aminotransferase
VHFTKEKVWNVNLAFDANKEKLLKYHMTLISNGVFFLPAKCGALSTSHSSKDLDKLVVETEKYVKGI